MSLFNQSNYNTINTNNITVSLPNNKDIYKTDIKKQKIDNKIKYYYEIGYDTKVDNFTFNKTNYKATKIYVYSLLHNNIDNLTTDPETDIIGELVVEYSFNGSIIYTCYLLKKNINTNATAIKTEEPDKIDDIINYMYKCDGNNCAIRLTSVKLNNILSPSTTINNKFIYYKDKNKKNIIIFLTPIDITYEEDSIFLSNLLKSTNLFDINPQSIPPATSSSNVGSDESLDCELVGVGTSTTPIDQLSMNQLTDELNRNIDLMKIGIYFFGLIVLIMITYTIVPYLFNIIINFNTKDNKAPDNGRMTGIFVITTIFVILFCFLLFHLGFKKNNISIIFVGFIVALLYILSILVIITKYQTFSFSFNYPALEILICECLKFTLSNIIPKYIGLFVVTIILIAIVLAIQKKNLKKTYGDTVAVWSILLIPITIVISIISYSPKKSQDSSCN
uniref:Uncharacterized protein n=1 Tax=viral metagenome TaxID=1070528 RepID=A0A6C0DBM0_9ZZZZ